MPSITSTSCALSDTTGWTNPTYISTSNNQGSTRVSTMSGISVTAKVTFTFPSAIPTGAIINGVEVTVRSRRSTATTGAGRLAESDSRLIKITNSVGTGPSSNDTDITLTTSYTNETCGSSTDMWGTTLTSAEVNAASFGVYLKWDNTSGDLTVDLDYVSMTVHYTDTGANNLFFGSNF